MGGGPTAFLNGEGPRLPPFVSFSSPLNQFGDNVLSHSCGVREGPRSSLQRRCVVGEARERGGGVGQLSRMRRRAEAAVWAWEGEERKEKERERERWKTRKQRRRRQSEGRKGAEKTKRRMEESAATDRSCEGRQKEREKT